MFLLMYCFTHKNMMAISLYSPSGLKLLFIFWQKRINLFFHMTAWRCHGCIYGMHNILNVYFASSSIFICSSHELERILVTRAWQQSDTYFLINKMSVFCVAYLCLCVFFLPECRKLYSLSTYGLDYTTPQLSVLAESRKKM